MRSHRFYIMISRVSWWATVEHSLLRLARGRGEAQWYREISFLCTRIAAAAAVVVVVVVVVVGAQRDRVAWLLFISTGSWLEYILPSAHTPPTSSTRIHSLFPASFLLSTLSPSLSLSLYPRRSDGDARTGSANLADFFMGKMVEANFALPFKLKGREKGEFLEIQRLSNVYIYMCILFSPWKSREMMFQGYFARSEERNRYSNDSLIFNLLLTETNSE